MKKAVLSVLLLVLLVAGSAFANSPQFLWKPSSESDGKLVVLFPSAIRIETVESITINGLDKPYRVTQDGANGDRIHARFRRPGSTYGKKAEVKLTTKSGKDYTWIIPDGKNRFEKITSISPEAGADNSTFGDLIKAEAPQGAVRLTNQNQGTEEYTVKAGEITVDAMLSTYGPAEMWIKDAEDNLLLTWKRANDKDPARLIVNGKEIEASNTEVAPGDFTPAPQKVKIPVEAGQVLKAHLSGEFGNAESYLVINE